jgi:hypothetical protein
VQPFLGRERQAALFGDRNESTHPAKAAETVVDRG